MSPKTLTRIFLISFIWGMAAILFCLSGAPFVRGPYLSTLFLICLILSVGVLMLTSDAVN